MSDTTNTDRPAFPVYDHHADGQRFLAETGINMRDYFAAKAMPLAFDYVRRINTDGYDEDSVDGRSNSFNSTYEFTWHEESGREQGDVYMVAEYAYQMADAMLKARGQQ